jgi:hypothetical protein
MYGHWPASTYDVISNLEIKKATISLQDTSYLKKKYVLFYRNTENFNQLLDMLKEKMLC